MKNIFYDIPFSKGNSVSKTGMVLNTATGAIYKTWIDKPSGFERVALKEENGYKSINLSRLMALIFIPKILGKEFVGFKDRNNKNINVENLEWISAKEVQDRAFAGKVFELKNKFKLPDYESDNGFYFNQIKECLFKTGYFYIPNVKSPIVINEDGHLFNLETDEDHPTNVDAKGYVVTRLHISNNGVKYKTQRLHRIVAQTFIKPAGIYVDYKSNDLQVNHLDGNKQNNKKNNLEWADGFRNMQHGRDNNLFSNQKSVICKNMLTGDILRFRSISKCSDFFNISIAGIINHLNSSETALIPIKGNLFKYDDDNPWPQISASYKLDEAISYTGNYVATNKEKNTSIIFSSLLSAITDLNLSFNLVKNHRLRKGKNIPFNGWVFKPLSDFTHSTKV